MLDHFRAETDRHRDLGRGYLPAPGFLELSQQMRWQNLSRWARSGEVRSCPFRVVVVEDDRWKLGMSTSQADRSHLFVSFGERQAISEAVDQSLSAVTDFTVIMTIDDIGCRDIEIDPPR